jgi:hypothetical protein
MISQIEHIKVLLKNFEDYLHTEIDLAKFKVVEKSSEIISSLSAFLLLFTAAVSFVLLLSIALAFLIGHLLGRQEWGFFIIAGVWAILCMVLYARRNKWPKTAVKDMIVKKILD